MQLNGIKSTVYLFIKGQWTGFKTCWTEQSLYFSNQHFVCVWAGCWPFIGCWKSGNWSAFSLLEKGGISKVPIIEYRVDLCGEGCTGGHEEEVSAVKCAFLNLAFFNLLDTFDLLLQHTALEEKERKELKQTSYFWIIWLEVKSKKKKVQKSETWRWKASILHVILKAWNALKLAWKLVRNPIRSDHDE